MSDYINTRDSKLVYDTAAATATAVGFATCADIAFTATTSTKLPTDYTFEIITTYCLLGHSIVSLNLFYFIIHTYK